MSSQSVLQISEIASLGSIWSSLARISNTLEQLRFSENPLRIPLPQDRIKQEIINLAHVASSSLKKFDIKYCWDLDLNPENAALILNRFPLLTHLSISVVIGTFAVESFCNAIKSSSCSALCNLALDLYLVVWDDDLDDAAIEERILSMLRSISRRWPSLKSLQLKVLFTLDSFEAYQKDIMEARGPNSSQFLSKELLYKIIDLFQALDELKINGTSFLYDDGWEINPLIATTISKLSPSLHFETGFEKFLFASDSFSSIRSLRVNPNFGSHHSNALIMNIVPKFCRGEALSLEITQSIGYDTKNVFIQQILTRLAPLSKLKLLHLASLSLEDQDDMDRFISTISSLSQLEYLSLNSKIKNSRKFKLTDFKKLMPTLKYLSVDPLELTPESVTYFAENSPKLRVLVVRKNDVGLDEVISLFKSYWVKNPDFILSWL